MSVLVECFDEKKAKDELKKCPKIVRDYFRLIQDSSDRWQDISQKAIKKLKTENKACEPLYHNRMIHRLGQCQKCGGTIEK